MRQDQVETEEMGEAGRFRKDFWWSQQHPLVYERRIRVQGD